MASTGFTNRLQHEKSPYLLQHAGNPVDWYPWGEAAFSKARSEDKPIFLSVGYSTCHWCHVMERESFENERIAALLNDHFVSIKVDREERPDVDRVYMLFVQSSTGAGGWPMSVFLTPDLKPFLGGTYYPPEDRYGRPGFGSLLRRLAEIWRDQRSAILNQSAHFADALAEQLGKTAPDSAPRREWLEECYQAIARGFDAEEGGFGGAPKFPRPALLVFLLRYWFRTGKTAALDMLVFTLKKMATGGMYDQLGGGFHRYSVDDRWHVPHFEKMLYDQAQLAMVYAEAYQVSRDQSLAQVLRDTLGYVLRDLRSPEGGFYSAEDADSLPSATAEEKMEGAFYVWTADEVDQLLDPDESVVFRRTYGVEARGNVLPGSDPHGELRGQNVLFLQNDPTLVSKLSGQPVQEVIEKLTGARQKLFAARERRPRPHLDDKIVTAWNGLCISGLARVGRVLDEPRFIAASRQAAEFLQAHLYDDAGLRRSYRQGTGNVPGFAEDYAFLIQGLLDLYEAEPDVRWLAWAEELQEQMNARFADPAGGYFATEAGASDILFRLKDDHDGAEPSANSVAASNLLRLTEILDRPAYRARAERLFRSFAVQLDRQPMALPQLLSAYDLAIEPGLQIVIATGHADDAWHDLWKTAGQPFLPNKVQLLADQGPGQDWLSERNTAFRHFSGINGQPAVYLCRNFVCEQPVTTTKTLLDQLRRATRTP